MTSETASHPPKLEENVGKVPPAELPKKVDLEDDCISGSWAPELQEATFLLLSHAACDMETNTDTGSD